MSKDPFYLLVQVGDDDLGILSANEARRTAMEFARETGRKVYLRHHVTDAIVATVRPGRRVPVTFREVQ